MDYVVERFHGRSLALAHSQEEIEELDLRTNEEKLNEDNRKFVRRGTYRLRKNRMTPSVLQDEDQLQILTQSTLNKQKLIDEATRKVREAESKAQDLSVNIQSVFFSVFNEDEEKKSSSFWLIEFQFKRTIDQKCLCINQRRQRNQ